MIMNKNFEFNYTMDDEAWDETVKNYIYYKCKNISENIKKYDNLEVSALAYPTRDLYIISIAKKFHHALISSLTAEEKRSSDYVFGNLQPKLVNNFGFESILKFNAAYKENNRKEMKKIVNEFKSQCYPKKC